MRLGKENYWRANFSTLHYFVCFIFKINYKLHPWSLGLIGFYTPEFQKLDFTPWSLAMLTIHTLWSLFAIKWHMRMLTGFIFAKLAPKLLVSIKNKNLKSNPKTTPCQPNSKISNQWIISYSRPSEQASSWTHPLERYWLIVNPSS